MADAGPAGRFSLAVFSLALSVISVSFGQPGAKVLRRNPRQAAEEDNAGSRVQGAWSPWGPWSSCSQPCGLGVLERTRVCQSPYPRVPWAGGAEVPLPLQPVYPQHSSYQDERAANPYPARPSYPLHTDRNPRLALSYHSTGAVLPLHTRPQPPDTPYGSANRYARQEAFPVDPAHQAPSWNSLAPQATGRRRDVLPPRSGAAAPPPPRPRGSPLEQDEAPDHAPPPPRLPQGTSRHGGSTRPAARASIPLFKPARRNSQEAGLNPDRPSHRSQADGRRHSSAASPTPESQEAWRSRVRDSIKPGKYGYGRVPFALPLHRDASGAPLSRFKRHHRAQERSPPPPPPLPPHPPSRKQKRKAAGSSSHEAEASSPNPEPRGLHGPEHPPLANGAHPRVENGRLATIRGASKPTEPALVTTLRSETSSRAEPHGQAAMTPPASPAGSGISIPDPDRSTVPAEKPHPRKVSARPPVTPDGPPQSVGSTPGDEGAEDGGPPAASAAPPSRTPSSPPPASELRLTHEVLRNHSSPPKRKASGVGKAQRVSPESPRHPEGVPLAHPDGAVHRNPPPPERGRSRNQRQNQPQTSNGGGRGAWPSPDLFVDQPVAPRPSEPNIWLLRRGNPTAQLHPGGYGPHTGVRPAGEVPQWNLYHPSTESFHCEGVSKQFKACRQEPCPPERPDPRAVQCSAYNNQEFMGRLYQWEPFTDVQGSQRCELNCRPIGYRFYVRHTEKVQDGTPCEASYPDICVAGQCLTPGCDGILGSNRTLDSCGVCGGDHTTCKLVVGNFSDTDVPIGYHRILEIPAGATRIQVKELTRSPNYLALRSHNGKSIINGNWAVNPPGRYEAAGTVFVYSRPGSEKREGESLTAEGPTTEPIDVYMIFQQDNPGVSYQFFLASPQAENHNARGPRQEFGALTLLSPNNHVEPPASHLRPDPRNVIPAPGPVPSGQHGRGPALAPQPPPSQSGRSPGILQRNVRVPPLPPPPPPAQHGMETAQDFHWRRIGNTECSATCGKGFWQSVYLCISRITQEEVPEEKCHLVPRPVTSDEACNTEPCPAYWEAGEWSACSKSCGLGTQHRQVLCRQIYANRSTMVHPQRCGQLEKPNATQTCQVQVCSHWEVHTNWSSCSVLCGTGHRTRHVRCISNHGDLLSDSDCPGNHRPKTSEACDMGPCVRTWFYSDWSSTCSAECGTGIQRRSVVCLSSGANGQVEDNCAGTKPADMRACNGGPCQHVIRWYRGPWSQCSTDCGTGSQRRDIICVVKLGGDFNVTEASECAHLEKPPSLQPCVGTSCEARWFSTAWSACSRSCVGGIQVREVQCLTQNKTLSNLCPPDQKPTKKRPCNVQPCLPDLDENCRDKYHNCPVIVQARLCVYSYYKAVCCASCTHALERRHAGPSR